MQIEKDEKRLLKYEEDLRLKGYDKICGVDEVGRGPLAGPVCVCAVIMDLKNIVEGVDDSKKLSEKKREKLYPEILKNAIAYKVVMIDNEVIDQINILNATKRAMQQAIENLKVKPDFVLIDAVQLPIEIEYLAIIKGDANSYSIACSSIIAKVERDRLMMEYDKEYPEYGFAKHKGYGTKNHIDAIKNFGALSIHRKTFIKNFVREDEYFK